MKALQPIRDYYRQRPDVMKALAAFSVFASFFLLAGTFSSVLRKHPEIRDFSQHIVSQASVNNFDVGGRIGGYYLALGVLPLVAALIFGLMFAAFRKWGSPEATRDTSAGLLVLSALGITAVVSGWLLNDSDHAAIFVFLLGIGTYLTYFTRHLNRDVLFWLLALSLQLSFAIYALALGRNGIEPENAHIVRFFKLFCPIFVLLAAAAYGLASRKGIFAVQRLFAGTLPVSLLLIAISAGLEWLNHRNLVHGIVTDPAKPVKVIVATLVLLAVAGVLLGRRFAADPKRMLGLHLLLTLIGLALVEAQPFRMISPEKEFFEFANHGLSVDQFFRYGSLPLIETFDAHMLSNQLFAYLYGFLNGYEPWAPFLYAALLGTVYEILAYFTLSAVAGRKTAFLVCLCLPFMSVGIKLYVMSAIAALCLVRLLRDPKPGLRAFLAFWPPVLLLVFFTLDIGLTTILAAVTTYLTCSLLLKRNLHLKPFLLGGAITAAGLGVLLLALCLFKGVDPLLRLSQFLTIASSGQNFGISDVGDPFLVRYQIVYHVLPALIALLLAWVVARTVLGTSLPARIQGDRRAMAAFVLFVFFAVFFIFYIPRGLTRHMLSYGVTTTMTSTAALALCCFAFTLRRGLRVPVFCAMQILLFCALFIDQPSFKGQGDNLFRRAMLSGSFHEQLSAPYAFNGTRVRESFSFSEIRSFKTFLDRNLSESETYVDYASTNYFHALTGRKNPFYINQMPVLVNGDKGQDDVLRTLREGRFPVVLVPNASGNWMSLDGVPSDLRYYKISEYLYRHYKPVARMSQFDIYWLKDRQEPDLSMLPVKQPRAVITDFRNLDLKAAQLSAMQADIAPGNALLLKSAGADPVLTGLVRQLAGRVACGSGPVLLKIKLRSAHSGTLQLFSVMKEGEAFSEAQSKRYTIGVGEQEVTWSFPSTPHDVRIDLELPEITLTELRLDCENGGSEGSGIAPEVRPWELGAVPLLWGAQDEALFRAIPAMPKTVKSSGTLDISRSHRLAEAQFLAAEVESEKEATVTTTLTSSDGTLRAQYSFRVFPGKKRYLLRLSASYPWWNTSVDRLGFVSEAPITIHRIAIVNEAGKVRQSGLPQQTEIILSNITDEFWTAGISTKTNTLLTGNTPETLRLLQAAKKLQLSGGRTMTITAVSVFGDYLHITTAEDVRAFPEAAFPARINVLK